MTPSSSKVSILMGRKQFAAYNFQLEIPYKCVCIMKQKLHAKCMAVKEGFPLLNRARLHLFFFILQGLFLFFSKIHFIHFVYIL